MHAIVREVPASIAACQLTHLARAPIDLDRARAQHARYVEVLASLGITVTRLPPLDAYPDSVFVEDTTVVLDDVAVLCRPGAATRRGEVDQIEAAVTTHRDALRIPESVTLDGGDVLRVGEALYVGITTRTTRDGAKALADVVAPYGVAVTPVPVQGALHLKTAVTQVGESTLLVNPDWVDASSFWPGFDLIAVEPSEPFAANAVWVNGHVIHALDFPKTRRRLELAGIRVVPVEASELAKAEGGVTCCSLLFA